MSKPSHCAECGAALPENSLRDLCSRCTPKGVLELANAKSQVLQPQPAQGPNGTIVLSIPPAKKPKPRLSKPMLGAALTVVCGLALWQMPLGERWVNASYDYLFRFGARAVTNKVVLILMDNDSYDYFHQTRGPPWWNRALHAELLNKLADDGCPMVVFDTLFGEPRDVAKDQALVEALRRQHCVVLMAKPAGLTLEHKDKALAGLESARPILPAEPFLGAANSNWGVAFLDPDLDLTVRKHWPFPAPRHGFTSLPWVAAQAAGAQLSEVPQEQWLRYYGQYGAWSSMSYRFARVQKANYFHDKIVFVGNKPATTVPGDEEDEFKTPYTRWAKEAVGGVEIMATAFLNLVNGEWLRRPAWWVEAMVLVVTGVLLGAGLGLARPLAACGLAAGAGLAVTLAAARFSQVTNYWFPWLVIVGGQVPCALAYALLKPRIRRQPEAVTKTIVVSGPPPQAGATLAKATAARDLPDAPDYELFDPPFAEGAYGKVWLARNAIGQWQALKAIYLAKFGPYPEPYEREFSGIKRYKPISEKHPGLLRVDFVSTKKPAGYFYYVMELGDALEPGWEQSPWAYAPRDLARARAQAVGRRLPVRDCVRIGIVLAEALDFLHRHGLTHRDIKPQNIIFVNGQPKLADVGLVAEILPPDQQCTWVGTPGYMPPPPEPPGAPQADIYGLGMVLYVIRTGRDPGFFPEVSTTLVESTDQMDFIRLNAVILKACQPDRAERYASAAAMGTALREVQQALDASVQTSLS